MAVRPEQPRGVPVSILGILAAIAVLALIVFGYWKVLKWTREFDDSPIAYLMTALFLLASVGVIGLLGIIVYAVYKTVASL